jgi:hypothetical protein
MNITWAFHLRIPILVALLQLSLPYICLEMSPELLENLILELPPRQLLEVTLVSLLIGFSLSAATHLVLRHGPARFGLRRRSTAAHYRWAVLALVPSLVVPVYAVALSTDPAWALLFALLGAGLAAILIVLAVALQVWLIQDDEAVQSPEEWEADAPFLILPLYRIRPIEPILRWAYNHEIKFLLRTARWIDSIAAKINERWGCGFIDYPDHGAPRVFSDHLFALVLLTLGFVVHYLLGRWQGHRIADEVMPPLAFLLLLIMLGSFLLSALAFFCDGYRFPLSLAGLLLIILSTKAGDSDHYFTPIALSAGGGSPKPMEVIAARGKPNAILVASEGGGIQSAAWTTKVLAGLQEEIPEFARHLTVLSGTSGGAVGVMYFVNAFRDCADPACRPDPARLSEAVKASRESSLEAVSWGLTGPDLARILLPPLAPRHDRGWALEETFRQRAQIGKATLGSWARRVRLGLQPAVIFNTTLVESGEPMVLSSSQFPARPGQFRNFDQAIGGNWDLEVATAARLSSSFPIVTPAARPEQGPSRFHVVDGGYYDNPGMASLLSWLDEGLRELPKKQSLRVLILVIQSFPPGGAAATPDRNWVFELTSPLTTLFNVRETAQRRRTETELDLLKRTWAQNGVAVDPLTIQFNRPDHESACDPRRTPLSWRLRQSQQNCIDAAWDKLKAPWVATVKRHLASR